MPTDLTLYGRPVGTVFDLLGEKENDITYAVGWALAESDRFTAALLEDLFEGNRDYRVDLIRLQEGISGAGFTDIEILANQGKTHVVLEAKRGYALPGDDQLHKYATRSSPPPTAVVVLAEAGPDFVAGRLPPSVAG